MSLLGHMDALTSTGYLEGWAHDPERPGQPLQLAALAPQGEIGRGLASFYRWDRADAGCGIGWCAFRLRVEGAVTALRRGLLVLTEAETGTEICRTGQIAMVEDAPAYPSTLAEVARADPTVVHSIDQLRGCGVLFERYLAVHGTDAFVRAAFVYILGRPADGGGLATYAGLLAGGGMSAYGLLKTLYKSDEFAVAPRLLGAPTEPGFVFAVA